MTESKTNLNFDIQSYIIDNGTLADKFRLLSAGYELSSEKTEVLVEEIKSIVNTDGGLPFDMRVGGPSSAKTTAEFLPLLLDIDSGNKDLIDGMVNFLISRQKNDGGFAEAMNLDALIEDRYGGTLGIDWYPVGKSITWLTGKALEALCLVKYDDQVRLRRARDFLIYSQNEDGHWPDFKGQDISDPLGTGNILPALRAMGVSSDNKVYKNGRAALFQHLVESLQHKSTYDMVDLAAVNSPKTDKEKEVLAKGLELITTTQNQDGGWSLLGSKKSDPELSSILAWVVNRCRKS